LRFFDLIVPCGIADRKATSLEKLLSRRVDAMEVAARLKAHFGLVFGLEMQAATPDDLLEMLHKAELSANVEPAVAQPTLAVPEQI
jgi:lipoate-protein ligase B